MLSPKCYCQNVSFLIIFKKFNKIIVDITSKSHQVHNQNYLNFNSRNFGEISNISFSDLIIFIKYLAINDEINIIKKSLKHYWILSVKWRIFKPHECRRLLNVYIFNSKNEFSKCKIILMEYENNSVMRMKIDFVK